MSMSNPALPQGHRAPGPRKPQPLEGEVIPPVVRAMPPDREAPGATPRASFGRRLSTALLASVLGVLLAGGGGFAAYRFHAREARHAALPGATALALADLAKQVSDLRAALGSLERDGAVRAIRTSLDGLRAELDTLKASNAAAVGQLALKLDHPPVPVQPTGQADVLARLDKLDHDPRMADIAARLDRIEHQVASPAATGSVAPTARPAALQSVVPQATAAAAKPLRSIVLDNWIVRDVYAGIALVEGRSGSIREVVPGESLPGAGEVRSIERRGRTWVVVTSRGIIDTQTW